MITVSMASMTYPRPPRPWTATVAPGIKPMFLIEFCVVFEFDQAPRSDSTSLTTNKDGDTGTQERGGQSGVDFFGDLGDGGDVESGVLSVSSI